MASRAVRGFLLAGLAIGGFTLVVGLALSRGISRPLVDLTAATELEVGNWKLVEDLHLLSLAEAGQLTLEKRHC